MGSSTDLMYKEVKRNQKANSDLKGKDCRYRKGRIQQKILNLFHNVQESQWTVRTIEQRQIFQGIRGGTT